MTKRGRPTVRVTVSPSERTTPEQWTRRRATAQGDPARADRLGMRRGRSNSVIATELRITRQTVGRWRHRFVEKRLDGVVNEPRPGTPRRLTDAQVEQLIVDTLEKTPPDATHWSTRTLAKELTLSHATVGRSWWAFGLQPHRSETFKWSRDPLFIDKVRAQDEGAMRRRTAPIRPDDVWLAGAPYPRLPTPWDDLPVRRARCRHRQGHGGGSSSTSESGGRPAPRGVKCRWKRGWRANYRRTRGVCVSRSCRTLASIVC